MTTTPNLHELAERLRQAEARGTPMEPLRGHIPSGGPEQAYGIQRLNVEHAQGLERRLVGRKIGLTSYRVQQQLGVGQPDFGTLFADMARGDSETIPYQRVLQPKIKAEIALALNRDLPQVSTRFTT